MNAPTTRLAVVTPPSTRKPTGTLRGTRQVELRNLLQRWGGLTRVEVRGLATRWHVTPEAILKQMLRWQVPLLDARDTSMAGDEAQGPLASDACPETHVAEHERLQKELAEARRIQQISAREIANARAEIARTAELRKRTAADREMLREQRQQIEALARQNAALQAQVDMPFSERLKQIEKDDLTNMVEDWINELYRRQQGGRKTRLGKDIVHD